MPSVKIVCLGKPVRACLECKGVWFAYSAVRDFARDNDWFRQLGAAVQLVIQKRAKKGLKMARMYLIVVY